MRLLATAMFATLVLLILAGCERRRVVERSMWLGHSKVTSWPNSIVISDMLATRIWAGRERISQVNCSADLTACEVTYRG